MRSMYKKTIQRENIAWMFSLIVHLLIISDYRNLAIFFGQIISIKFTINNDN